MFVPSFLRTARNSIVTKGKTLFQVEVLTGPRTIRNGQPSRRVSRFGLFTSSRQGRLTALQETADRGVALETDRDLVCAAGFVICARLGKQLRARSPVGLVFGEPHIGGYLLHRLETGAGTVHLRDRQSAIDCDHR